jgi:hypothetical protein
MQASEYPVSFVYGATTKPYSKEHPHTGEDRKMPVGTDVNVGDSVIGLSGGAAGAPGSGQSTGPHLHIQKWMNGRYASPMGLGLANTIAFPATVIETGAKVDVGNYVRVLDAKGVRWSYFHLSDILVLKGHVINKGEDMRKPTKDEIYWQYKLVGGIEPSKDEVDSYLKSGKDYITVMEEIKKFYADKGLDFFTFKKSVRKDEDKIRAAERIIQAVEAAKEIK